MERDQTTLVTTQVNDFLNYFLIILFILFSRIVIDSLIDELMEIEDF